MKNKAIISFLLAISAPIASFAQDFVNLDFESANIPDGTPVGSLLSANQAIPGWTASVVIFYNTVALGETSISIIGTNGGGIPDGVIDGSYTVNLFGGLTASSASISQTGLVPAGTESLLFKANGVPPPLGGTMLVTFEGENVPYSAISTGPNYTLYGADISAFAGQTGQLTFSTPEGGNNYWELDDIQFSPSPVPEPGESALFALGALSLGVWRWRKSARLSVIRLY